MIGKTISQYKITDRLGEGGMGVVYKAFDTRLEREVALKFLRPEFVQTDDDRRRFVREAQALAALDHPNVCTVYELDEADGRAFIAMAFVKGRSLKDALEDGPMEPTRVTEIAGEIARGLRAAHERGIVHRDIKGANVMITPDGVRILDFGLARSVDRSMLTRDGVAVGTIAYMSPEQASGHPVDHRTDIWSLGVLMYQLLTGVLPFHADFDQAIVYRILNEDPTPLDEYDLAIPAGFQSIIDRALARKPDERFQTAQDFLDAVNAPRVDGPVPSGAATRPTVPRGNVADKSVAVLNFENLSGNPEDAWLSAGIPETVTVDLKRVGSLTVIARADVVKATAGVSTSELTAERVADFGGSLGARWVVWGTYQKIGESIRITAHFSNSATGGLTESFKVDGSMSGIFQLQDQIVTRLTDILNVEIESGELDKIQAEETREEKAWEYYTRGRQIYNEFGAAEFDEIRELYEKALELDPDYALAVSGLGSLYVTRFINQTDPNDLTRGIELCEKAVELDPDIAEPLAWLAYFYGRRGDIDRALETGRRAVRIEDNNPITHYTLGTACVLLHPGIHNEDQIREGMRALKRCIELAPQYQPALMMRAWMFMLRGQYNEAEPLCVEAAATERSGTGWSVKFVGGFATHANLLVRRRQLDEAQALYEEGLTYLENSGHVYAIPFTTQTWCGLGDIAYLRGRLDQALKFYGRAVELTEANDNKIAMGYYYVRGNAGMAKSFFRLGVSSEVQTHMDRATAELKNQSRFNYSYMWEAHNAHAFFALTDSWATMSRCDEAIENLEDAVRYGWRDLPQIEIDSKYRALDGDARFRELLTTVRSSPRLL